MTVETLVRELRSRGVELRADGERVLFRPPDRVPPELRAELRQNKAEVLRMLEATGSSTLSSPLVARVRSGSVKIYSKVLDAELWIVATEEAEADLRREGVTLPILLPSEAEVLGNMAEADTRALLEALRKIQKIMPGSRLRSVIRGGADA